MKPQSAVPRSLCALGVALFLDFASYGQATISQSVQNDTSPPLRDLVAASPEPPEPVVPQVIPLMVLPPVAQGPAVPDPVLQTSAGPNVAATINQNFDGISADGFAPPDTNGAAGLTQYVQIVNVEFAVYSKTGTLLLGPARIHTLWAGFGGPCSTSDGGDPIVNYDRIADRWVISQLSIFSRLGRSAHA